MKTSYILITIVAVVLVIGGVFMIQSNNNTQTPSFMGEENTVPLIMEEESQPSLVVSYTDEGYSPKELKIKKGETVMFKNRSSQPMWTASAIHPTHTVYPGTSIQQCANPQDGSMFDSCLGTSIGENWTFQFDELGSWGYHNHLRPSHWGKVIVE